MHVFYKLRDLFLLAKKRERNKKPKEILEQTIEKQRQNNLRIKEENRQQIEKLQEQLIAMEKERQEGWERSTALAREESTGNS